MRTIWHSLSLALLLAHSVTRLRATCSRRICKRGWFVYARAARAIASREPRPILVWRFLLKGQRFYCNDSVCWSKPNGTKTVWRTVSDLITVLMHPIFLSLSLCLCLSIEPNSIIKLVHMLCCFGCHRRFPSAVSHFAIVLHQPVCKYTFITVFKSLEIKTTNTKQI